MKTWLTDIIVVTMDIPLIDVVNLILQFKFFSKTFKNGYEIFVIKTHLVVLVVVVE